ncbi:Plasma membrane ATP-binding cassette (ABC) transporter [Komagataella phaffii CBS 7435]|uniref:Plasma membrane ATP binding cassette (ABC) transporter n=2 Tax=Komagataella phaffii TaxID=460519 RepID=C4R284_KOMPG|nr:Plasma membrane ATP binding cassette (ABC) transporter [Komagataella phaffii GS115]AOA62509.1 GQ67_01029T0 [Komagataella phaffii]CAH2447843.1 Plasma membrane ATP-binding cassette (ABC) transporter [Komagataella phaffii CBS 7435]AOA67069.1 GQ68_00360T0 [Komagataella phaffii GS115]CAY69608.1 Plasma membrane ATP binding cassette (ABC) transporter [Komagataella phaffii GS115]CCA38011.1 Plasma membrane ATP-binding cassette (ABC) transporter [Komagataella phaffii CBS 7435]
MSEVEKFEGSEEAIQRLARTLTNQSSLSFTSHQSSEKSGASDVMLSRASTRVSQLTVPGESPFDLGDPRLDPQSDQFSAKYWIKNLQKLHLGDTDYYKPASLGILYRNLRCEGENVEADYQTTVFNVIPKYLTKWTRKVASSTKKIDILSGIDGMICHGDLVVVLGRPGAGCTTLLKTIASQTYGFKVSDDSLITYDGLTPHDIRGTNRGDVIYNAETEMHFPHLTVWQTLLLASRLKVPQNRIPGISRELYAEHITQVYMEMFGVSHTKNTKVGDSFVRGVSGGERKRVSIVEACLCNAKLQCWDNATRGLDSATALNFVKSLRLSCDTLQTTSLVSIYQSSQEAYDLFDKVILLYEGRQIFFGPTNRAKKFFQDMGFHCPKRQTTADFLTSLTSPSERIPRQGWEGKVPQTPDEFEQRWKSSPEYEALMMEIDNSLGDIERNKQQYLEDLHSSHVAQQSNHVRPSSAYTVSYSMQVKYATIRSFQRILGNISQQLTNLGGHVIIAFVISSMFYNLAATTDNFYFRGSCIFFGTLFNSFSSVLEIFALYESRPIVEKHKQYGLYHPSADAIASIISEVPIKVLNCVIFNVILYFMVHLRREPGPFFFFLLNGFTSTFVMSHIYRTIGAMTKSLSQAMTPASVILLALSMYAGFIVPKANMLGWSKWINYINPVGYAFEAIMINEFHGRNFTCDSFIPSGGAYDLLPIESRSCSTVGSVTGEATVSGTRYLREAFDFLHSHKWRNYGIQVGYVVFFFFTYILLVEINPSAKQKGERTIFQRSFMKRPRFVHENAKDIENNASSEKVSTLGEEKDANEVAIQTGERIFHWQNVTYTIPYEGKRRTLLSNVDGWVKPGSLTALMGVSGAGKTTLLDVLADRISYGVITGDFFVNGQVRDASFQRSTGYVQQQDLHLDTSTVREALLFSACLRQSESIPYKEKADYVEEIIDLLEMRLYADAVVGVPGEGLNVEQRKRLTIGVELVAKPDLLLFLDEPTSGLDSQTAWSICQLMKKLSNKGQAILCTIHQPSSLLFQEFDRLLLLQTGGETVYFGDVGPRSQTLIQYFEKHGASKCPKEANPAEWMLKVISDPSKNYHDIWVNSEEYSSVNAELDNMRESLAKLPYDKDSKESQKSYATSPVKQFYYVIHRILQQYYRTPSYIWSKLILSSVSCLFNGFTFFDPKNSIQGLQNQMFSVFMMCVMLPVLLEQYIPHFVKQRNLYEARERPSKTFSWPIFILSQVVAEIPWMLVAGTISFFCWYYPAGLYKNAGHLDQTTERGALVWLLVVAYFVYTATMATMCIAGISVETTAANVAVVLFCMSLMFAGVLKQKDALPGFWKFMYYVSPFTWFIQSILTAGLANAPVVCSATEMLQFPAYGNQTCGEFMAPYMAVAGGYLANSSTQDCAFCQMNNTNVFLATLDAHYSQRWRNWGIFVCYAAINTAITVFIYWLVRVPKENDIIRIIHNRVIHRIRSLRTKPKKSSEQ